MVRWPQSGGSTTAQSEASGFNRRYMASIADQHVVVLGGTSGFGFATAKAAIAEGARVTIASRLAEKVRSALKRLGNAASGESVDVTDKSMLERFFAGLGPFDHLAVTVGDPLLNKQILDLTDEEARSAFEVRFWVSSTRFAPPIRTSARRAQLPWSRDLPGSERAREEGSTLACLVASRAW